MNTKEIDGLSLIDSHPMVEIINGILFLGNKEINVDGYAHLTHGLIPVRLVARKLDGEFICGVDLCSNGLIWNSITREETNDLNAVFELIKNSEGCDFNLHIEEPLIKLPDWEDFDF